MNTTLRKTEGLICDDTICLHLAPYFVVHLLVQRVARSFYV